MTWLKGLILGKSGRHRAATPLLYRAYRMLSARKAPLDVALVGLDLISSLLREGKRNEALNAVSSMTPLIFRFRGNKLAESALIQLTDAGLQGRISQELVDETAEKLKRSAPQRGCAPGRL